MTESAWMLHAAAALMSVAGFAWLALAMDVHWRQVHGDRARAGAVKPVLRVLGMAGLAASALLCALADRPSMAVLVWLMLLAGSAPLVALTLAWRPRLLRVLSPSRLMAGY